MNTCRGSPILDYHCHLFTILRFYWLSLTPTALGNHTPSTTSVISLSCLTTGSHVRNIYTWRVCNFFSAWSPSWRTCWFWRTQVTKIWARDKRKRNCKPVSLLYPKSKYRTFEIWARECRTNMSGIQMIVSKNWTFLYSDDGFDTEHLTSNDINTG